MPDIIVTLQRELGTALRDRRIAASDEYRSTRRTHIFGAGAARRMANRRGITSPGRFPAGQAKRVVEGPFPRDYPDINTIILHSTAGNTFIDEPRFHAPTPDADILLNSRHRIDFINAHFVITQDGQVFYTRDVRHILNNAGGRRGIDIEFAGTFSNTRRISPQSILAGRLLVTALKNSVPTISHIHPHGQVQKHANVATCGGDTGRTCGKFQTCPGPDIWVNIGEHAVNNLHLEAQTPHSYYQNNGISPAQTDTFFRRNNLLRDLLKTVFN